MAEDDLDYHIDEDLEQLFHGELQNLELGHGDSDHDDIIGDHLPEWLVGVIVVIAMLIVAFFIMIITSLIKNRKKHRSSTYIGSGSATNCDDLESGKIGHRDDSNMKMTSFTSVPDTIHDTPRPPLTVSDSSDPLTPGSGDCVNGLLGCKNPLFVDDEPDSDDINSEGNEVKCGAEENREKKAINSSSSDVSIPSTSSGYRGSDMADHGKSKGTPHKYKPSSSAKKSTVSIKTEVHEGDKISDGDGDVRKRMFMSKTKCGHQNSSKREKMKEISSNNSIFRSDEPHRTEGIVEVNKEEGDARPVAVISSDSNIQTKGTCGTCEDSGVELSSPESHLKEETGGSSESDDFGSNVDRNASHEITMECSDDHELDILRSENNTCSKSSPSVLLSSKADSPPSIDSFHVAVCSQNSSLDNSTENLDLSSTSRVPEKNQTESLGKSSELLQLKNEAQEKLKKRTEATHAEHNKNTNMLPAGALWEETASLSCVTGCSDFISADETDKTAATDQGIFINPSSTTTSVSTLSEDTTTTQSFNRQEREDTADLDRVLSTNL